MNRIEAKIDRITPITTKITPDEAIKICNKEEGELIKRVKTYTADMFDECLYNEFGRDKLLPRIVLEEMAGKILEKSGIYGDLHNKLLRFNTLKAAILRGNLNPTKEQLELFIRSSSGNDHDSWNNILKKETEELTKEK